MKKYLLIAVSFIMINAGLKTSCDKEKPLTIETVRQEINTYKIEHGEIVLAQAILETEWFTCDKCSLDGNNLFGWSHDGITYLKFKHWDESVAMYKIWQSDNYFGGDYYEFLDDVGYASDTNYVRKLKQIVEQLKKK